MVINHGIGLAEIQNKTRKVLILAPSSSQHIYALAIIRSIHFRWSKSMQPVLLP